MLLNIWITFETSGIISRTPLECNSGKNLSVQLFSTRSFLKNWWPASRRDHTWSIAAAPISTTSTSKNFSYLALESLETSFVYTSALLVLLLVSTVVFNEPSKKFNTCWPDSRWGWNLTILPGCTLLEWMILFSLLIFVPHSVHTTFLVLVLGVPLFF